MDTLLTNKELAEKLYRDVVSKLLIGGNHEVSDVDIAIELVDNGVPKERIKEISKIVLKMIEENTKGVSSKGVSKRKFLRKSKIAPISSVGSIILGGGIALIATFSFLINILTTRKPEALLLDMTVMTLSYLTAWQGIYYTIVDRIAKERM